MTEYQCGLGLLHNRDFGLNEFLDHRPLSVYRSDREREQKGETRGRQSTFSSWFEAPVGVVPEGDGEGKVVASVLQGEVLFDAELERTPLVGGADAVALVL